MSCRLTVWLVATVFLAGCQEPPLEALLDVSGFDTDLPTGGLWIVETLVWAPDHPEAGQPEHVLHSFVLASAGPDCGYLANTWDGGPAQDAYHGALDGGVVGEDLCELERQAYSEQAESPFERPGLAITIQLWNTQIDDDHIGVEPDADTYTALDGPDADVIEYASFVTWTSENWAARVADELDCTSADPSSTVNWESTTQVFDMQGPITFDPGSGHIDARLDIEIIEPPTEEPVGTVEGDVRFDRCEVERILPAPGPVG